VVLVAWLAACALEVVRGVEAARSGVAQVDMARSRLSGSDVVNGQPLGPLGAATADFSRAHRHLSAPWLAPLKVVPVVGRQLTSLQDLSVAAEQASAIGRSAIARAQVIFRQPHDAGPERVATLRSLAGLADQTQRSLSGIRLGPSEALVGPLAAKRDQFAYDLGRVTASLGHASSAARVVADLLATPHHYLLLAANNAEMRAGSGMFLQVGVLSSDDGTISISPMQPTGSLTLPVGEVPVTGDLAARWGWLQPGSEWRNLGLTPQFDVNAPLAARMWQAVSGQAVDGVVAVDLVALQQVLSATGPVVVDGQQVGADNVLRILMHDQYLGLELSDQANALRRDRLGTLARSTVDALENRQVSLSSLATAVADAAAGRHILAWSPDPAQQRAWQQVGVAGQLTAPDLMAAVINRGGNKLDQYLSVSSRLSSAPDGPNTAFTLEVTLANRAPLSDPDYIIGPYPRSGYLPGEYVGLLAVNVPGEAFGDQVVGYKTLAAEGPEGPTWLMAAPFTLLSGASTTLTVRFVMPGRHGSITVLPSARVPAVPWRFGHTAFTDSSPRRLSW
jgi:hypothetical protein